MIERERISDRVGLTNDRERKKRVTGRGRESSDQEWKRRKARDQEGKRKVMFRAHSDLYLIVRK